MKQSDQATRSRLEDLTRAECLQLLGYGSFVGRVGFTHDSRPMILPVNYLLDGDAIVFRTAGDTVLNALAGQDVAFEVDDNRPLGHSGWSVVVQGPIQSISDMQEIDGLERGPLRSWARRDADHWLRISIDTISGRRLPES